MFIKIQAGVLFLSEHLSCCLFVSLVFICRIASSFCNIAFIGRGSVTDIFSIYGFLNCVSLHVLIFSLLLFFFPVLPRAFNPKCSLTQDLTLGLAGSQFCVIH